MCMYLEDVQFTFSSILWNKNIDSFIDNQFNSIKYLFLQDTPNILPGKTTITQLERISSEDQKEDCTCNEGFGFWRNHSTVSVANEKAKFII